VLFEEGNSCFPLESDLHREFRESDIMLQQRKRVLAVVSEDHTEVLRLHRGAFAVRMQEEDLGAGIVQLTKSQKRVRLGDVVASNHDRIRSGGKVLLPKKKGTEFNGLEYFTEDKVYFHEQETA
jgi:hypothetical protein